MGPQEHKEIRDSIESLSVEFSEGLSFDEKQEAREKIAKVMVGLRDGDAAWYRAFNEAEE